MDNVLVSALQCRESFAPTNKCIKDLHGNAIKLMKSMDETQTYRGDFKEFKLLVKVCSTYTYLTIHYIYKGYI